MALETVSFISDLVAANPVGGTDSVAEGDNHIRNIKTALLGCFPGLAGRAFRVQSKSANYTVIASDNTTLIIGTATLTLTLTAVTTLGNGFLFHVYNNTRGLITINPNSLELINDYLDYIVLPDRLVTVFSDGVAFYVIDVPEKQANPIINSAMRFWGEGTATLTCAVATTLKLATGMSMQIISGGTGQIEAHRDTTVPSVLSSNILPVFSTKLIVKTAVSTPVAGTFFKMHLEGFDIATIAQRPFTFSMWIRSSLTGVYNLSIQNGAKDQSYVKSFLISGVNTYEFKRFLVAASPSAGAWNYSEGTGIVANIGLAWLGATSTNDAWTAADRVASTANANFAGTLSASMNICAPLISLGYASRIWTPDLVSVDALNCSRYMVKTFDPDVKPADAITAGSLVTFANPNGDFRMNIPHPNMRITPTVTLYNPSFAAHPNSFHAPGAISDFTAIIATDSLSNQHNTKVANQSTRSTAANFPVIGHAKFDARL